MLTKLTATEVQQRSESITETETIIFPASSVKPLSLFVLLYSNQLSRNRLKQFRSFHVGDNAAYATVARRAFIPIKIVCSNGIEPKKMNGVIGVES